MYESLLGVLAEIEKRLVAVLTVGFTSLMIFVR